MLFPKKNPTFKTSGEQGCKTRTGLSKKDRDRGPVLPLIPALCQPFVILSYIRLSHIFTMPIKLYYNGHATLYREPSNECQRALNKARERKKLQEEYINKSSYLNGTFTKEKNKRFYRLSHHNRQQLISSAYYGHDNKIHKVLFVTLTYPESIFLNRDKSDKASNEAIKKFLNNLRTNYGLAGYEWTKELTKKGTPHYHLLMDVPFIDIQRLNNIWENNAEIESNCCVRHDPKHGLVVKSPNHAGAYVAKYISKISENKSKDYGFDKRIYAISNSWQVKSVTVQDEHQIKAIIQSSQYSYESKYATSLYIGHKLSKDIFNELSQNHVELNENEL